MEVHWGEVDGVPTLWAESGEVQGPLRAGLSFGVGRSDETIGISGINHLIEHLALEAVGRTSYAWNGWVTPVSTCFAAIGAPDQVVEFLDLVTRRLGDLPLERLDDEIDVLRIESNRRGNGQLGYDLATRFGPYGAGLLGWPEYGLNTLTGGQVEHWARERFTARNAVLWLSGPVPGNLRLGALTAGEQVARAGVPTSQIPERACLVADTPNISVSLVSERQWGVTSAMEIARQRSFESLRRDAASYSVDFTHVPIGVRCALEYVQADGTAQSLHQVAAVLTEVIDELVRSGPDDQEVARMREQRRQFRGHPDEVVSYLDSAAQARLLGRMVETPQEVDAIFEALDTNSMQELLAAIAPTIVVVGPEEVSKRLDGWTAVSEWSTEPLIGSPHSPIASRERGTLVVAADGISWERDDEHRRTIHWNDVEACFSAEDGIRSIVSTTGIAVLVVPWNWQGGAELTELVDQAIDPDRVVRVRDRRPDDRGDAARAPDVRWLGTIVGAVDDRRRVDIVLDTDRVLLLYRVGNVDAAGLEDRLQALSSGDREDLLASDPRSFCIRESDIEFVKVRRRVVALTGPRATLTIAVREGHKFTFSLMVPQHVEIAENQFRNMVGARFRQ